MSDVTFWIFVVIAFIFVIAAFVIASFGLMFLFGAPYVGTPRSIAREMLKVAEIKRGDKVMDIGSGSGTILLVAITEFGASKAIGYEINPFLVWITRLRAWMAGVASKIEVKRVNFYKAEIEQVDVITTYLLDSAMKKLYPKLKSSLDPDTRLVSRGFEFDQVKPVKEMAGSKSKLFLYRL
jgi:ribosomal protein L11 methylase PrmA